MTDLDVKYHDALNDLLCSYRAAMFVLDLLGDKALMDDGEGEFYNTLLFSMSEKLDAFEAVDDQTTEEKR